jgi:heat shock protein HtpX
MLNIHDEIRNNERKSVFVLIIFTLFSALIFGVAAALLNISSVMRGNYGSFIVYYVIAMLLVFFYIMYFLKSGDKLILSATGATQASRKQYPYLYHTTEALSIAAGMSVSPKCYVIKDSALNAYATGFRPEKSYIVVTTGLMEKLNRQELEGVLAHEMSHIKNKDIKLMLYVAGLIGIFTLLGTMFYYMSFFSPRRSSSNDNDKSGLIFFALWILFAVIGVFFATLFKFWLSRRREYLADMSGANLTRYPEGLASALEKIKGDPDPLVDKANKATAHLFISTPFRKSSFTGLFSTHPPIDDRIKRLRGKK